MCVDITTDTKVSWPSGLRKSLLFHFTDCNGFILLEKLVKLPVVKARANRHFSDLVNRVLPRVARLMKI